MTLHSEIARIVSQVPPAEDTPPDPAALRASEAEQVRPMSERLAVDNVTADDADGVPVRIYTPVQAESYGIVVYFHGGYFCSGSLETHDSVARHLAVATGHRVIAVDYRLAPENAFPAGLVDCYGAVQWVVDNGEQLGWNGQSLAVAGDGAGGNLAAAVAGRARDEGFGHITHQVLYYPVLDLDFDRDRWSSLREYGEGYGLEYRGLRPFTSHYLASGADPSDPRVSPIKREDLSGLPQALVITAGYDPLRDEAEAYARDLRSSGVPTTLSRYESANHGFVANFYWLEEFQEVFHETAYFLNGE